MSSADTKPEDLTLRINEIFFSIQGETSFAGLPTVFIRLTGCPLRCQYCDTEYAFYDGEKHSLNDILNSIKQYKANYITVTGGEPLAQKNCFPLLNLLCNKGYTVSLETSGAMDIATVDPRVHIIMDIKTPASKEESKNRYDNIESISSKDQIKFVICDRADYDWSKNIINQYSLTEKCECLFSPSHTEVKPVELAEWILEDKLNVRFQTQIHKQLWNDEAGH